MCILAVYCGYSECAFHLFSGGIVTVYSSGVLGVQ